jgi:hypothetical protein
MTKKLLTSDEINEIKRQHFIKRLDVEVSVLKLLGKEEINNEDVIYILSKIIMQLTSKIK